MIALVIRAAIGVMVCAVLGLVGLAIALGGMGLLGWALFMALAQATSPVVAAVLTAIAAFVVALIFVLFGLVALRIATRPRPLAAAPVAGAPAATTATGYAAAPGYTPAADLAAASNLGSFVGSQVSLLFRSRPLVAAAAALSAGLAVGLMPGLRRRMLGMWR